MQGSQERSKQIADLLDDDDLEAFLAWAMPLVGEEMVVGGVEWTLAMERLREEWDESNNIGQTRDRL